VWDISFSEGTRKGADESLFMAALDKIPQFIVVKM
jgi:hypothetical protein